MQEKTNQGQYFICALPKAKYTWITNRIDTFFIESSYSSSKVVKLSLLVCSFASKKSFLTEICLFNNKMK